MNANVNTTAGCTADPFPSVRRWRPAEPTAESQWRELAGFAAQQAHDDVASPPDDPRRSPRRGRRLVTPARTNAAPARALPRHWSDGRGGPDRADASVVRRGTQRSAAPRGGDDTIRGLGRLIRTPRSVTVLTNPPPGRADPDRAGRDTTGHRVASLRPVATARAGDRGRRRSDVPQRQPGRDERAGRPVTGPPRRRPQPHRRRDCVRAAGRGVHRLARLASPTPRSIRGGAMTCSSARRRLLSWGVGQRTLAQP